MTTVSLPDAIRNFVTVSPEQPDEQLLALDSSFMQDLYKEHGAILFRGFPLDFEIFRQITARLCFNSIFNNSPGRQIVDKKRNIQTVNLGDEAFPLHPELSREPWKPDACWFACMLPPKSGGETTICDGVEVVRKMTKTAREGFMTQRLRYVQPVTPKECQYWFGSDAPADETLDNPPANCPFRFSRQDNMILRSFTRPALHRPMFSEEPAFGNFLLFARYGRNNKTFPTFADGSMVSDELVEEVKRISDALTVAIRWQKNDLVLLDNTRFMHGRNRIENVHERLILSYFGYLKFAERNPEDPPNAPWRISV
ncbi:MAG: TauD/TfdA family dioxygenase [Gammaproteobacteria bacterium]|nr:TauD/TfdA family dioxygenase [Gammaproteobacteria bacterium]